MNIPRQIYLFLKYRAKAKTQYRLHSPFIFEFYQNVLADKRCFYAYEEIEITRERLEKSQEFIPMDDHGAGSRIRAQGKRLGEIVKRTAVPKKYGRLLFRIANYYNHRSILELGTATGISTAYLAAASRDARVISIEGNKALAEIATRQMKSLEQENVEVLQGTFENWLPGALDEFDRIDLLYLDGNHRKQPTLDYFDRCLPKLANGAVVIVDDINWSKEMTEAWRVLKGRKEVSVSVDLFRMGLLFIKKEQEKEDFILFY